VTQQELLSAANVLGTVTPACYSSTADLPAGVHPYRRMCHTN